MVVSNLQINIVGMDKEIPVRLHNTHIIMADLVQVLIISPENLHPPVCIIVFRLRVFFRSSFRSCRRIFRRCKQDRFRPGKQPVTLLLLFCISDHIDRPQTFFLGNSQNLHLKDLNKTLYRYIIVGIHISAVHDLHRQLLDLMQLRSCRNGRHDPLRRESNRKAQHHRQSHDADAAQHTAQTLLHGKTHHRDQDHTHDRHRQIPGP